MKSLKQFRQLPTLIPHARELLQQLLQHLPCSAVAEQGAETVATVVEAAWALAEVVPAAAEVVSVAEEAATAVEDVFDCC